MRWAACTMVTLGLACGLALCACGAVASPESGAVSPADRAVPEPASGHRTDGPTATRTSAQRPVEEQTAPEEEPAPSDERPDLWD